MKKIYVLRVPWLTDAIVEVLRRILQALGFELVLLSPEAAGEVEPDDTVLVAIDDALDGDAETCGGIEGVLSRGASVVGVWPLGQTGATLPVILGRVGSGSTTCTEDGIRQVVDTAGDEVWLEPGGQPMAERPLKRGGC